MDFDLIIGTHSIYSAVKNPNRFNKEVFATEEGLQEYYKKTGSSKKELEGIKVNLVSSHKLQEDAKRYFKDLDLEFQRIPSGIFLVTSKKEFKDMNWLIHEIDSREELRILCLDQVSDVHNAGAILRTASFYGVHTVIVPSKNSFGMSPSFYRIASGATEYIELVPTSNMTKTVSKLIDLGVKVIALSEHSSENFNFQDKNKKCCLVFGKEDTGISHAVLRVIPDRMSLKSQGDIKSLNVSVASAIAMEKCFGGI